MPDLLPERYSEFVALYRTHFLAREDSMQLFEGMKELLQELSARHVLAIATGKSRRGLDRALEATGLKPLFSASRCADETNPKPHPAMLEAALFEAAAAAGDAVMIGDTSFDMAMARSAGVRAIGVAWGYHTPEELVDAGAQFVAETPADLGAFLLR